MSRPARPRVVVIGLDSVPPALAFGLYADAMPFLSRMREDGAWGALRSTDPPVTVPAWVTMTSGLPPGKLGVYGFRNRRAGSYAMEMASARSVAAPRLWDLASDAGLPSVVVSVPLTYPATERPGLSMTTCFLTPDSASAWAEPSSLKAELEARHGAYQVDVEGFRTDDKRRLVEGCVALTRQHFAIFRDLLAREGRGFAMLVDMGPDRLHHGLLASICPAHPRHDPSGPFRDAGREYYALLDREIASTVGAAGDALVMVVSDHGVRPLEGGFCLNEWLAREGYLVLEEMPNEPTPVDRCRIDWSRTRAWGEGGYHGRLFLNVAGREPRGVVPPSQARDLEDQIRSKLLALRGPGGAPMGNLVHAARDLYPDAIGLPPDLTIYFGGLALRSIGSVGHGGLFTAANDTGPDDANHDPLGILVMAGGGAPRLGRVEGMRIADVFATACDALGLAPPAGTGGRSLLR
jgi:predicted AlkP superfamily phosphohydrolase/phosphomutase